MTIPDRTAEIRARHNETENNSVMLFPSDELYAAHEDRAYLLTELEKLKNTLKLHAGDTLSLNNEVDDVTWCEVKADIMQMIAAAPPHPDSAREMALEEIEERWHSAECFMGQAFQAETPRGFGYFCGRAKNEFAAVKQAMTALRSPDPTQGENGPCKYCLAGNPVNKDGWHVTEYQGGYPYSSIYCIDKLRAAAALSRQANVPDSPSIRDAKDRLPRFPASFTYEHSTGCYYFRPDHRTDPPYRTQREVQAIIDIASDGSLAGVEIGHWDEAAPPPPPRALKSSPSPTRMDDAEMREKN